MSVGLLGELPAGGCSKLSGIVIDNSTSISIVMLGQETMSLGHSETELEMKLVLGIAGGLSWEGLPARAWVHRKVPCGNPSPRLAVWGGRPAAVPGPHLGLPGIPPQPNTAGVYELLND